MIKDLIQELGVEKTKEQLDIAGVVCSCYASYDGRIWLLGCPKVKRECREGSVVLRDTFVYCIECDGTESDWDRVTEIIKEKTQALDVYKIKWQVREQYFLQRPQLNRFCLVRENMILPLSNELVEYVVGESKAKASAVATATFKQTLSEWINALPTKPTVESRSQDDKTHKVFRFIDEMDYLLLAEDIEIGDLYVRYEEIVGEYTANCLSLDR